MNKAVIIYYSYTNNTRTIAKRIQEKLQCDLLEIKTVIPYSDEYDIVVEQGKKEVEMGYTPEIEMLEKDLKQYDTIILGTPVWWYTIAPAVKTFLTQYSLEGKKIIPFATNGGWIGHTIKDIVKLCPNSQVEKSINIRFSEDTLITSTQELEDWIEKLLI